MPQPPPSEPDAPPPPEILLSCPIFCYVSAMNNPLYRPPAEANSLILQIDQGCPHNSCTFCGMYRRVKHNTLALNAIHNLCEREATVNPDARRIFLADGDVMRRPFGELKEILGVLNSLFPSLSRVGMYANGSSIAGKSPEELRELKSLKLHTLYMGLESGDQAVLDRCGKRESVDQMIQAGIAAQKVGIRMSVMVLLGLGGTQGSQGHAKRTAEALNLMRPRLLSALRVIPVRGTPLAAEVKAGTFHQVSERQAVEELRMLLDVLALDRTVFAANHSSNVAPINPTHLKHKAALLGGLDALLRSDILDAKSPGAVPRSL